LIGRQINFSSIIKNFETEIIKKTGISFGTVLAVTPSWFLNKSIFWAIFHRICGWFYIIYYAIGNPNNDNMDA
jgi:hypothetical protein